KLAVGYRLDELPNDITKTTPASFEPVLDYVVCKFPRFAFEKFPAADPRLTTQMKSVGESMAIGRTFKEAFQKGIRALEIDRAGWVLGRDLEEDRLEHDDLDTIRAAMARPTPERIYQIKRALLGGLEPAEIARITAIDPVSVGQMAELGEAEREFQTGRRADGQTGSDDARRDELRRMKRLGFSDPQLARLAGTS